MKLYMPTRHTLCYSLDAIAPTRGSGPPKHYPKLPALVFLVYCGQTTVASPVCCCVWMRTLLLVTFALDELAVSQATEHQNATIRRLNLQEIA